ncbi:hypothetical protein TH606_08640 [Thermodesulfatator autotrophicus]|uniref:Uncharacterized protein n=1 Tax=Thermodesulfatator autotrophicus TaxID=1795632 RepID=A0A177E5D3_9BACT|nr:hypothetical protein TH606_08640 [Thermodesulfatator autotrophicus]
MTFWRAKNHIETFAKHFPETASLIPSGVWDSSPLTARTKSLEASSEGEAISTRQSQRLLRFARSDEKKGVIVNLLFTRHCMVFTSGVG